MANLNLSREDVKNLIDTYNDAVREEKEMVEVKGHLFVTRHLRYQIEHINNAGFFISTFNPETKLFDYDPAELETNSSQGG